MGLFSAFAKKKKTQSGGKNKGKDLTEEESTTIIVGPKDAAAQQDTKNEAKRSKQNSKEAKKAAKAAARAAKKAAKKNKGKSGTDVDVTGTDDMTISETSSRTPAIEPISSPDDEDTSAAALGAAETSTSPPDTTSITSPYSSSLTPLNSDQTPVTLVTEEHQVIPVVRESLPSPTSREASQSPTSPTDVLYQEDEDDDSLCLSDSKHGEQSPTGAQNSFLDAPEAATSKTRSVISDLSNAHQKTSSEDESDNEEEDAASLNLSYENDDEIRQLMDLTDLEADIRRGSAASVDSRPMSSTPTPVQQRSSQPQKGVESLAHPANAALATTPFHDMKTPRARAQIPTPTPHNDKTDKTAKATPAASSPADDEDFQNITQKKLQHQRELEEIEAQLLEAQKEHEQMEQELRNSLEHSAADQHFSDDESTTSSVHNDGTELDGTRDLSQIVGGPELHQEIFNSMAEEIDSLKSQQNAQNAALQEYKSMVEDQRKALEMWSEYQREMFNKERQKMVESLKSDLQSQDSLQISISGATPSSPGGNGKNARPVPRLSIPANISNGVDSAGNKSPRRRSNSVHRSPHAAGSVSSHSRTQSISSVISAASTASSSSRTYSRSQSRNVSPRNNGRLSARKSPRKSSPKPSSQHSSPTALRPNGNTTPRLNVARTPDKQSRSRQSSPERKKSPVTASASKHSRSRSDHGSTLFWTKPDDESSSKVQARKTSNSIAVPKISLHEASSQNIDVSALKKPAANGSTPDVNKTSARSATKTSARKKAAVDAESEPQSEAQPVVNKTSKRRKKKSKKKKSTEQNAPAPPEDEKWRFFVNERKEKDKKKFNNRFERLYNVGVEKKRLLDAWAENERKKKLEKEILDVRPTPAISDVSRKIAEKKIKEPKTKVSSSLRDSAAWDRLYEISKQPASPKRLKDITVYEQSKLVECTFEPELSRGTNQIAWRKIQSGERELPAFEALFREAKVKNDVLNHIIQEKARAEMENLPKSRRSTLSKSERKELFERLVSSNAERDKELDAIREHMEQESQKTRSSSAGRSRSRSGARKRDIGGNIGEYLYKEGVAHLENKKQREREFEKELERTRSKGHVSKMSNAALEKLRERSLQMLYDKLKGKAEKLLVSEIQPAKRKHLAQSDALKNIVPTLEQHAPDQELDYAQFRSILQEHCDLYQISVEVKFQRRQEELLREANQETVFKPALNPKSVQLDKRRRSSQTDRYLQLLQIGAEKEERLNEMRKSLAKKELENCTFSPSIDSDYQPRRPRMSLMERSFSTPRSLNGGQPSGELDLRYINGELNFDDEMLVSEDDYEMIVVEEEEEDDRFASERHHKRIERLA